MNERRKFSLAFVVALYTAVVIALGMALYAVYQYYASPGETVFGLMFEHSWHVLVLGVLIYITLYAVLYMKVVQPIRDLYLKLYGITRGNLSPVDVDSEIVEIAEIAEGVQLLIEARERAVPEVSLSTLYESAQDLRTLAKQSSVLDNSAKDILIRGADRIEETVERLFLAKTKTNEGKSELVFQDNDLAERH